MQQAVIGTALDLLEKAWKLRITVQAPVMWNTDKKDHWRERFMRVDDIDRATVAQAGEERRERQQAQR